MAVEESSDWEDTTASYVELFEPLTGYYARLAARKLDVEPTHHVLDLASGPGAATSELLLSGTRVTALDFAEGMIAVLREREPDALGRGQLETVVADGQSLALADNTFDAAISAFGVVLFADFCAGLSELRRVTKPNGSVAVTTWPSPDHSVFMTRWREAIREFVPDFDFGDDVPGLVATAKPDSFRDVLSEAGFEKIEVSTEAFDWPIASAAEFARCFEQNPYPKAVHNGLGDEVGSNIPEALRARLEKEFGTEPFTFETSAHIATMVAI